MFESLDVSVMNETDVREAIVRPLLTALGYRHGTKANIRTEITLRYDQAFLGRKAPKKDPKLQGRADYICEVIPYGRWIVEVKSPSHALDLDDAQQAHTYAAHPEVAAKYYMLTNGREFDLYQTGSPFEPVLSWPLEQSDSVFHAVANLLGPDAIEKGGKVMLDHGRPLGPGLGSQARIVGGSMSYAGHHSTNEALLAAMKPLTGMRNTVRGQEIRRVRDGVIEARIELEPAFNAFDEMNRALGFVPIVFKSADEVISTNPERPSIFANVLTARILRGTVLPASPVMRGGVCPIDCEIIYHNQAVGYLEGTSFCGSFTSDQELAVTGSIQSITHWGRFELVLV
ncbi:type I restriction enzyme HsdR N-terminal domain-containing protein [Bradyrhizobium sp. 48]|uniref:type I restriction enzyme HsdR N-terminal domain-containing protein n=2 Tax=unclassified Bradyrhizobium TaxID=2631580 RepID=UPI001FF8F134|nr:type I restriction enzyme HsdR N-terminal domain-containing protein [Bradyrhizobium sp. 48]MCK1447255.1 type I restriction enzyme HsdR N-terminal domain-containing protein [Bradyrhizobium sp. 48]